MPATPPSDYRLSPALNARLTGLLLVTLALLLFGLTALVATFELTPDLLVVTAVLGLVGVFSLGYWLNRRAWVVRLDEDGYRVRLIRGAGVTSAAWTEVEDASTGTPRGIPCVVLRLQDGRTTTIPAAALAADREEFVRDLQAHLQRGQGLRPI
ncbi:hypothetical protein [Nocardioides sp.]|uniref:hypothetical protein n=1 Tax=Nocardioides sp. TaxID=35761 RepID=UPI003565E706